MQNLAIRDQLGDIMSRLKAGLTAQPEVTHDRRRPDSPLRLKLVPNEEPQSPPAPAFAVPAGRLRSRDSLALSPARRVPGFAPLPRGWSGCWTGRVAFTLPTGSTLATEGGRVLGIRVPFGTDNLLITGDGNHLAMIYDSTVQRLEGVLRIARCDESPKRVKLEMVAVESAMTPLPFELKRANRHVTVKRGARGFSKKLSGTCHVQVLCR